MAKKVMDLNCPNCSAPLFYNAEEKKWKCEFCDGVFTLEDLQKHDHINEDAKEVEVTDSETEYVSYHCSNCGAEIVADDQTSATFCVYCGNASILKNKLSGEFKPRYIIPFKVDKKKAIEAFKNLKKGRLFVPNDFVSENNINKITGIYIPFWLYDVEVNGDITINATRVSSWTTGDYRYTKTDVYEVVRGGTMNFEKVPADGSTRFDDDIMTSIEPFNYKDLIDFHPAYLSGFLAERYDETEALNFNEAADRCINSTKDLLLNDATGYATTRISKNDLVASKVVSNYTLLPVYMVNVKYKDKMYQFAMNGQTGEFIGDIPLDKGKVRLWSIGIFVLVFAIVFIILCVIGSVA